MRNPYRFDYDLTRAIIKAKGLMYWLDDPHGLEGAIEAGNITKIEAILKIEGITGINVEDYCYE